jgi:hypothetical protein
VSGEAKFEPCGEGFFGVGEGGVGLVDWIPAAILPNLYAKKAVEGDVVAFVPCNDPRVQEFCAAHPNFKQLISRFTNAFGIQLDPVIQIVRNDVASKLDNVEPLASFRDLLALSVVPYARSLAVVYENPRHISYSNSFWLYPWMLGKDNIHIVATTPAVTAVHVVEQFHGQSSPELSTMVLTDVDQPLFEALLARWKRHFLGKRQRWEDRALFRSLNMAAQAAQLPAGMDSTIYDVGRIVALWVAAFEILTHPHKGRADLKAVYAILERVAYLDPKVSARRYAAYRSKPRRPLPCWLYGKMYLARCDFLHGEPLGVKPLSVGGSKVSLFWIAPCLYRLALTAFLGLSFKRPIPKTNPTKLGEYIASKMGFERFQKTIERALLRARE